MQCFKKETIHNQTEKETCIERTFHDNCLISLRKVHPRKSIWDQNISHEYIVLIIQAGAILMVLSTFPELTKLL